MMDMYKTDYTCKTYTRCIKMIFSAVRWYRYIIKVHENVHPIIKITYPDDITRSWYTVEYFTEFWIQHTVQQEATRSALPVGLVPGWFWRRRVGLSPSEASHVGFSRLGPLPEICSALHQSCDRKDRRINNLPLTNRW